MGALANDLQPITVIEMLRYEFIQALKSIGLVAQDVETPEDGTQISEVEPFKLPDPKPSLEKAPSVVDVTDTITAQLKTRRGLSIFKNAEGRFLFIAQYSNNLRDNDFFSEIISGESHKRFVQLVKDKKAPLPELWLFHQPEFKVGEAVEVAVDELVLDEETGDSVVFAMGFGFFDPGTEMIAEALTNAPVDEVAMSHGMPIDTISRWELDFSIITQHETVEFSVLDRFAAANRVTGFFTVHEESDKGKQKMIDPAIRQRLTDKLGIPAGALDELEARNAELGKAAQKLYIERKSKGSVETAEINEAEQEALSPVETQENELPDAEEIQAESEVQPDPLDQPMTRGEVVELLAEILAPVVEGQQKATALLTELKSDISAVKKAQVEAEIAGVPRVTLAAMVQDGIKRRSTVGSPETRVDGRTELAKSKPDESAAHKEEKQKNAFEGMFS